MTRPKGRPAAARSPGGAEPERAPGPARAIAPAAGVAVVATFVVAFLRLRTYVLDDTYISLRYARHLAEGRGLVYNPGERVEGYTNFLWTMLMAVPHALGLPPVAFLKIVLALATVAVAWATARLARASGLVPHAGRDRWLPWLPGALVLLTPLVVERAADGLETLPFTLLLVLAAALAFEPSRPRRPAALGLALAGLSLTRPDGMVFAPVLLAIAALRGATRRALIIAALAFLVPSAIHLVGRHAFYGDWLPNTFHAKRGGAALLGLGATSALGFLAETGGWAWLAALPALLLRRTRGAAALVLAVIGARLAFHLWAGGEWVGRHRFLVPCLPFLALLVVAGIAALRRPAWRAAAAALALVLLTGPAWLRHPERESNALAYARGLAAAHGALGRAIAARTAPDALLAMDDAGLGPYLARRRNLDLLGLNDRHIARLPGRFSAKVDVPYVLGRAPDLVVLVSAVAEPTRAADLPLPVHAALAADPAFHARYEFLRVYSMRPDYHLGVFRRRDSRAVPADF